MRKEHFNKILCFVLASLLLLPIIATSNTVEASVDGSCLTLTGEIADIASHVKVNQPFELVYSLTPGGEYTEALNRDPFDIAFVVDVSGSMDFLMDPNKPLRSGGLTRLAVLKEAARALIDKIRDENLNDRVGLIKFSTSSSRVVNLTTNYNQIKAQINNLSANGGTNIQAAQVSAREMLMSGPANREKLVILITDGYATHYTNPSRPSQTIQNPSEARKRALQESLNLAERNMTMHTIALGVAGGSDVDHLLLEQMAANASGNKYDAANTDQLIEVFDRIVDWTNKSGKISDIVIKQKLPHAGFILHEDNPSDAEIVGDEIIIRVPDIEYPYSPEGLEDIVVKIIQAESIGDFSFEDADLLFRDACEEERQGTIVNNNSISVSGWEDRYGNIYVGTYAGDITRYRLGNLSRPQWQLNQHNSYVSNITFKDSVTGAQDDAIVVVHYGDGTVKEIDLRPTAPVITLLNSEGLIITNPDANEIYTDMKIKIGESVNQLPGTVDYKNDDFRNDRDYITAYQYRINGGAWITIAADTEVLLENTGEQTTIEAKAFTKSISNDPNRLVEGAVSSASLRTGRAAGDILLHVEDSPDAKDANPKLSIEVAATISPIQSLKVTIDDVYTHTFNNINALNFTREVKLADIVSQKAAREGWKKVQIEATNAAGDVFKQVKYGDAAPAEVNYFKVNPGPYAVLETEGNIDYTSRASSVPVIIHVKNLTEPNIIEGLAECAACDAVKLAEMLYKVETNGVPVAEFTRLGSKQLRIVADGTNVVTLKLIDEDGIEYTTTITVKIDYNQKRN